MGNTFEVWAFVVDRDFDGFEYVQTWSGNGLIRCLLAARRAKKSGAGRVKVEWR